MGVGAFRPFAPKQVAVRVPWGEFSPQPEYLQVEFLPQPEYPQVEFLLQSEYQFFTKMTQRQWLDMKISPKECGSKGKSNTQQDYVWHWNTQRRVYLRWKRGLKVSTSLLTLTEGVTPTPRVLSLDPSLVMWPDAVCLGGPERCFKNVYGLIAFKISTLYEICIFQCMCRIYVVWNFTGYWNSTQLTCIVPIIH